ncbi:hypothetical protein J4460_07975 [Candidatus Woesearchaeota archaeon]|nr:hypothetical protein [Candidatus Woesearchaeota archaeon]HIH38321.1 hypothetical protein [Candidatus Woesearchaeota archaeon]HIJ03287.1 hypothetical protein [Candidatus Woesearchaeota archaeon]
MKKGNNRNLGNNRKKGFFATLMEKMDKKLKSKAEKKCCCSGKCSKK